MEQRRDLVIILFLLGLFLLCSPFTIWWMAQNHEWYLPYLLWMGVIVFTAILSRKRPDE